MKKLIRQKNIVLIPLLIISLVVFYCPVLPALAEGEETPSAETPTETPTETIVETTTDPTPPPDTIIETGDVESVIDVENIVNTNIVEDVESEVVSESEQIEDEIVNESEEIIEEIVEEIASESVVSESIEIVSDNEAEVENEVEDLGLSGDNSANSDGEGNAIIKTGNVNLVVGLVNLTNSNIVGSSLSQILFNIFKELNEDINVSDKIASSSQNGCLEGDCLNVVNENEGSIENNVLIEGSSGDNSANTDKGDAVVDTGDVNAFANIFNVLNSNIVGSNWTQLIINVFGNWIGDLVLPGKEEMRKFLEQQSSVCGGGCNSSNIVSSNGGVIENEVQVQTNTGLNEASGNPANINTGTANTQTDILNIANSNLINNNLLFIAINNFGKWQGSIFSLPPGVQMTGDSKGIKLFNLGLDDLIGNSADNGALDIVNENLGYIKNSVIINLSTGNNSANSDEGSASIDTGNANTLVNLLNVLNSNINGGNLLLGMINIFGDWQGDVAFGRPDLWIGESAVTSSNPAKPGGTITYTLTYTNNGDADATGVTLTDDFDEKYLEVIDSGNGVVADNPGEVQWDIGTVPVGGSGSVSYSVAIAPEMPHGPTIYLINQSIIDSFEDDTNDEDNTDSLLIEVPRELSVGYVPPSTPELQITKISNVSDFVYAGSTVDYTITITNLTNGVAYDVVVNDILSNGGVINNYSWYLGTVYGKEVININYTIAIGSEIPAGFYINTARAIGVDAHGSPVVSSEDSVTIEVKNLPSVETSESEEQAEEIEIASPSEPLVEETTQIGQVGIGEEKPEKFAKTEKPEVLAAKTSGSKLGTLLVYSQLDDWIYIILLVILLFAALLFVILYLNDRRKAVEKEWSG